MTPHSDFTQFMLALAFLLLSIATVMLAAHAAGILTEPL